MKNKEYVAGIIALSALKGIGPAFVKRVTNKDTFATSDHFGQVKQVLQANSKSFDDEEIFASINLANDIIYKCSEDDIKIIALTSDDYPVSLKELKDPPPVIYCKGNIDLLYEKVVCIIGTRDPNDVGIKIANRIGAYFADNNWTICNGLAEGIDISSVEIDNKFHTKVIGVLAGGLNYNTKKTLLKKTAKNAEQIIETGGLLISEVPPDKKEDTFTIVKSCRIQAGLSKGLILIQSSLDGGSRFTLKAFCDTKRPLGVVNPLVSDFELPVFSANKEIVNHGIKGVAKFVEMNVDKVRTEKPFIIKSKSDYKLFENQMDDILKSSTTLFD